MLKALLVLVLIAVAAAGGLGAGYYMWGRQIDWYAVDIAKLGPGRRTIWCAMAEI